MAVRTNLIYNPSFEVDTANVVGENNGAGSLTITRDTGTSQVGSASLKAAMTAIGTFEEWRYKVRMNDTNNISVVNGTTYTLSVYIKGSAAKTFKIALEEAAGASGYYSTAQTASTGSFTRHSLTFTATVDKTMTVNLILNQSDGAAWDCYADAVLLEVSGSLNGYFDGATSAGGFTYAWTGTANNSTSTETTVATNSNFFLFL